METPPTPSAPKRTETVAEVLMREAGAANKAPHVTQMEASWAKPAPMRPEPGVTEARQYVRGADAAAWREAHGARPVSPPPEPTPQWSGTTASWRKDTDFSERPTTDWKAAAEERGRMLRTLAPKQQGGEHVPDTPPTDWKAEIAADTRAREALAPAGPTLADQLKARGDASEAAKRLFQTSPQRGAPTPGGITLSERLAQSGNERERARQQIQQVFARDQKPSRPEQSPITPGETPRKPEKNPDHLEGLLQDTVNDLMSALESNDSSRISHARGEVGTMLDLMKHLMEPEQRRETTERINQRLVTEFENAVASGDKKAVDLARGKLITMIGIMTLAQRADSPAQEVAVETRAAPETLPPIETSPESIDPVERILGGTVADLVSALESGEEAYIGRSSDAVGTALELTPLDQRSEVLNDARRTVVEALGAALHGDPTRKAALRKAAGILTEFYS